MALWQPRGLIQTGRNWRRPQTDPGGGGTMQTKVTFMGPLGSGSGLTALFCSIGMQATAGSPDAYDTVTAPVELLFGGNHGFATGLGGGLTAVSDWVTFAPTATVGTVLTQTMSTDDGAWNGYSIRNVIPLAVSGSPVVIVIIDITAVGGSATGFTSYGTATASPATTYYSAGSTYNNANPGGLTGPYGGTAIQCVTKIETQLI